MCNESSQKLLSKMRSGGSLRLNSHWICYTMFFFNIYVNNMIYIRKPFRYCHQNQKWNKCLWKTSSTSVKVYCKIYMLYSINFILHAHNLDNFIYENFHLRLTRNKNVYIEFVENNKTNLKHLQAVCFFFCCLN